MRWVGVFMLMLHQCRGEGGVVMLFTRTSGCLIVLNVRYFLLPLFIHSWVHRLIHLNVWKCLQRVRRYCLVGGVVVGALLWSFKNLPHSQLTLCFMVVLSTCKHSATARVPHLSDCCRASCHDGHGLTFWYCKLPISCIGHSISSKQ